MFLHVDVKMYLKIILKISHIYEIQQHSLFCLSKEP